MKIILRGVRGSIPTSGPETKYYGGNTACTEVSEDGCLLVLDGGSGMQHVQVDFNKTNRRIDILLSHLHLDHIQGLGFFRPLFDPQMEVHIWGPASSTHSLHMRLSRYLSPPLFPVVIRDLPCKLVLHEIENSVFETGPFKIQSAFVLHPGPTVGYRITSNKSVFTYLPDHEPALGLTGILKNTKWISGFDLANGTDLLYHDGQYTTQEYKDRIGWGHSCQQDALLYASLTGAKRLLLAHHDPSHTDAQLTDMFLTLQKNNNYPFQYEMAVEGTEINLP